MVGIMNYKILVALLLLTTKHNNAQKIKLEQGETCETCGFDLCTCEKWSECEPLRNEPMSNITFCNTPRGIVCCPAEPKDAEGFQIQSPSDVACKGFANYAPKICPTPFIANGRLVKPGGFPSAALLGKFDAGTNKTVWVCGGTLISERFVLSASHCLLGHIEGPKTVRLGDLDYSSKLDDTWVQEFSVNDTFTHPQYSLGDYFDIMLVKLNGSVTFNHYVLPACLLTPSMMKYHSGDYLTYGWGSVNNSQSASPQLRGVQLKLQTNCSGIATKAYDLTTGLAKRTQFCAFGKTNDTCKGDSGGPLLVPFPHSMEQFRCLYMAAGIISKGQVKCGEDNLPSINTNVTTFLSFIEYHVWPSQNNLLANG